jgi:hypothetical protein
VIVGAAVGSILGIYHLGHKDAVARFGVYEIHVANGGVTELLKIGKAHLDRITKRSGLPTRLHQQVRIAEKEFGVHNVHGIVVRDLGMVTTAAAEAAELAALWTYYNATGIVPRGNLKSFPPKVKRP